MSFLREIRILVIFFSINLCANAFAGGSVVGMVKYDGPLPHAKLIHMDADPVCYTVNKGNVQSRSIILGDNNTLGNVFVYIKSGLKVNFPIPNGSTVLINQAGC